MEKTVQFLIKTQRHFISSKNSPSGTKISLYFELVPSLTSETRLLLHSTDKDPQLLTL